MVVIIDSLEDELVALWWRRQEFDVHRRQIATLVINVSLKRYAGSVRLKKARPPGQARQNAGDFALKKPSQKRGRPLAKQSISCTDGREGGGPRMCARAFSQDKGKDRMSLLVPACIGTHERGRTVSPK